MKINNRVKRLENRPEPNDAQTCGCFVQQLTDDVFSTDGGEYVIQQPDIESLDFSTSNENFGRLENGRL